MVMCYWIFPLVIIFSLAAVLGAWHSFDMERGADGEMSGCLFTGGAMLCEMSVIEHLAWWQGLLAAVPSQATVLLTLLAVVLLSLRFAFRLPPTPSLLQTVSLPQPVDRCLTDPFVRAFAQGILHPKIYEVVR